MGTIGGKSMRKKREKPPGQLERIDTQNSEVRCADIDRAAQKMIRNLEKVARNSYQACPRSMKASGKRNRREYLNEWAQADPAGHAAFAALLGAMRAHKERHEEAAR